MKINLNRAPFHDNIISCKTIGHSRYTYYIIIPANSYDKEDYKWFISRNIIASERFNLMIYEHITKNKNIKKWTKKEYDSLSFDTYQESKTQILKRLTKNCEFIKMKQKKFEKLTGVKIFKILQSEEEIKKHRAKLLINKCRMINKQILIEESYPAELLI
jgi:hypothetical protein